MVTLNTRIQEKTTQQYNILHQETQPGLLISAYFLDVGFYLLFEPIELTNLVNIQKCKQMVFQMSI